MIFGVVLSASHLWCSSGLIWAEGALFVANISKTDCNSYLLTCFAALTLAAGAFLWMNTVQSKYKRLRQHIETSLHCFVARDVGRSLCLRNENRSTIQII